MTGRIPPTEAELRRRFAETHSVVVLYDAIDEIRRLRALCGRAIPFIERHPTGLPGNYRNGEMIDELARAAKGEI
jgi:hypothetical protein